MDATQIVDRVKRLERPRRVAVSTRFPALKHPVSFVRRLGRKVKNRLDRRIARTKSNEFFPCVTVRHQSVLRRKLGESDATLQERKGQNLRRACQDLNGLILQPGEVFSLWETIGRPTYKRGYVDGMLLSSGKVVEGVGGGLCQLSNFLCWLFLHADTQIIERFHHSMDVFPDSGRVLPFGSGATCLYNIVDLKMKNTSLVPLQLKIWVTENHLKGQLVAPQSSAKKFSLVEREHTFIKRGSRYFRSNELWRLAKVEGQQVSEERVFSNFAPVLYEVTPDYLSMHGYPMLDLTGIED